MKDTPIYVGPYVHVRIFGHHRGDQYDLTHISPKPSTICNKVWVQNRNKNRHVVDVYNIFKTQSVFYFEFWFSEMKETYFSCEC